MSNSIQINWRCQVESPILNFFLLVLRVSLNYAPDGIDKRPRVAEILPKERFELVPRPGGHFFALVAMLVLVPAETDPATELQTT